MRKLLPVGVVLVPIFFVGGFSWDEEAWGQPGGVSRQPWAEIQPQSSDLSALDLSPVVKHFQNVLSLKSSYPATPYLDTPQKHQRHNDILRGQEPRSLNFLATSTLFDGKLTGEGEVAYSSPALNALQGPGDAQHRLLRFGLTGTQGTLRYGLTYRSTGKAFTTLQDQAMREVWGEWQAGITRLRSSRAEVWNNVEKDPSRPRLIQTQEKIVLTLAPATWPEISLSYSRGSSSSSHEPSGVMPQRSQVDTLESALSYTGAAWTARLASAYSLNSDRLHPGMETEGLLHSFSASYRPTTTLTLAPSLSMREDRQRWSGVRIETPTTALSLNYSPDKLVNFTAVGSYSKTHSTDGLVDSSAFNATSKVSWTFQESSPVHTTLSIEAAYRRSVDAICPTLSNENLSGLVLLQVAGF